MTTHLLPMRPAVMVRACAHRNEPTARKSSSNWWTPLFGWSSDPDYIDSGSKVADAKKDGRSESNIEPRSRFAPGCFTEEKAKLLRTLTIDTSSHHDAMYHSAIASRLASDFNRNSDLDL